MGTTTTTRGFVRPEGQYPFDLWPKGGKIQDRFFNSYVTYLKPSDEELSVQLTPDCIFFESTEELHKFRIKISETDLYAREKIASQRVGKNGSLPDEGTVWNFEEHNPDGVTWYHIRGESKLLWKAYAQKEEEALKIREFQNDKSD